MDFTNHELSLIGQIMEAERTMPDDFWHVAAVQELACVIAKFEAVMTDAEFVTLIGIGAMLARHGKREMAAEIEMKIALCRAMRGPE